jgi:hypothetical protein
MICRIIDPAGQHCFARYPPSSLVAKSLQGQRLPAPMRDADERSAHKRSRNQRRSARYDSRSEKQSLSFGRSAVVLPWSPKASLPDSPPAPIRDAGKEPRTKEVGISDAAGRAIRRAKGNIDSLCLTTQANHGAQCVKSAERLRIGPTRKPSRTIGRSASVHHCGFEDADHRGVRRVLTQVTDPMRHVAPVAQRLAGGGRRRRLADLDLKLALQN